MYKRYMSVVALVVYLESDEGLVELGVVQLVAQLREAGTEGVATRVLAQHYSHRKPRGTASGRGAMR